MVGEAVGPYRILEKLGAGGMGEVYLAEDTRLGRKVALKRLADVGDSDLGRKRLLREAQAVAALNHPNIAAVYDVIETGTSAHIVMEYVRGESLAQRVRSGPLPWPTVVEIATQVCDALGEAHANGIIHRDLKPANLALTPDGRVKVLDFGLAKTQVLDSGEATGSSSSGSRPVLGTPPYISPEHLLGESADERSDIYSLGVTLYELLAGRRPFEGGTALALATSILGDSPKRLRTLRPDLPPALDDLVFKAMAREPSQRFPSAAAVKKALRALPDDPTDKPTASLGRTPARRSPRDQRGPRVLAAVATALAVGTLLVPQRPAYRQAETSHRTPVVAVLPFANLSGDPANEYLGVGFADVLTSSLARLPGLNVVSRSATLPYRDRKLDSNRIARDLGADYFVEGAVHRSNDQVRVTLSLLRSGSNVLSWSRAYDGAMREMLTLQREVADAVVTELDVSLSAEDRRRAAAPATTDTDAMVEYARASALLERPDVRGNVDRAIDLFREAVARDPKFAIAHAALGRAYWAKYLETKDAAWTVRARDATAEALRIDPDEAAVRRSLAVIYKGTGRVAEAKEELLRAIRLKPASDDAPRALGELLAENGEPAAALEYLSRAIGLRPNFSANHEARGYAHYLAGQFKEAVGDYQHAIDLQPDNAWSHQMLGACYHALGELDSAVAAYQRAVAINHDAYALANLGLVHYERKQYRAAATAYQDAIVQDPAAPLLHGGLGDCYSRLGETERASGEYEQAIDLLRNSLKTDTRNPETLAQLALYGAKVGRMAEARVRIREALDISPRSAGVAYLAAATYAVAGDIDEGYRWLKLAFDLGQSRSVAAADDDLRSLHDHPGYRSLIADTST